jgi:NADH-quinone oxidoreductase subunit N
MDAGGVVGFYLATYLPMTVLAFLILAILRANGGGEDVGDFRGLAKRSPMLAFTMTLALASLAGLPLTAGFMGKLFVFVSLVDQAHWWALVCASIGAASGFYYYFKPILAMYGAGGVRASEPLEIKLPTKAVAGLLATVILLLGIYPKPLQGLLSKPVPLQSSRH